MRKQIFLALLAVILFTSGGYYYGYQHAMSDYPANFPGFVSYLRNNYNSYKHKEDSLVHIVDSLSSNSKPISSFYTKNGDHITIDLNTGSIIIKNKGGGTSSINTGSGNMYIDNSSESSVQVGNGNSITYNDDDDL
jgi:frataxin-like iron-binding protein CyaY